MIKVGDKVLCRLYNTPDGKFYGDTFEAEVIRINPKWSLEQNPLIPPELIKPREKNELDILVKREDLPDIWLHRKEILRIITTKGAT